MKEKHHLYFYRYNYQKGLAKRWRELPCHVVEMDDDDHRNYHALCFRYPELVPARPPVEHALAKTNECRRHSTCTSCAFYDGEKDYKRRTGQG